MFTGTDCKPADKSPVFAVARRLRRFVRAILSARMSLKYVGYGALAAMLWKYAHFSVVGSLASSFIVYLAAGGWRFWRTLIRTLPRDARALMLLLKTKHTMKYNLENNENIVSLFTKNVKKNPNKTALVLVDGREWSFREVDEYSNAFANYLQSEGYQRGDVVAIYMENCPEFACFWLGMAKVGVVGALINFNLRADSLVHCIRLSEAKGLVFSGSFASVMKDIRHQLPSDMKFYCYSNYDATVFEAVHLDPVLSHCSTLDVHRSHVIKFSDILFYIYTSGTTGMPKAAIIKHSRFFFMTFTVHTFFNMTCDDVVYDTLPLYHSAGGILGIGQSFIMGCTVVIRKKFSASRFWEDCIKYNCTVMQYIGEICRYLLVQPPKPTDRRHRVWCAFGNGLRAQIWSQFVQRFNIKWVGEFYGATEGNANILNPDNKVGAVGFLTQIAPFLYPVTLIRVNEDTGELIRDQNGLCVRCKPGQPGELVGKIIKGDPLREFDGYVSKEATKKKVARNVFSKGDHAFLTGDILVTDELGYLYFKDRTGDTFRWRGENVSTAEVEATISNILKLNDASVYGVEVPGVEGKAGMAAIVDEHGTLDLKKLCNDLQQALPSYARPVFLRVGHEVDVTGTFKLRKTDYKKDGYDPSKVKKDRLYYLDSKLGEYREIDSQVFSDIQNGKIRI